jgi:probable addiction module antidote protein
MKHAIGMKAKEAQMDMAANLEISPFDAADHLGSEEAQLALLNDAIGTGNIAYIANAVGAVARARAGMSKLARDTGIKRQTLTKSLSKKGNPTLATIVPVLDKLGLRMQIVPARAVE